MFEYRYGTDTLAPIFQPFRFNGGALPLNLVETVHEWDHECVDRIDGPVTWNNWLSEAGLPVPERDIDDGVLAEMRVLREAIALVARSIVAKREISSESIDTVNRFAVLPLPPLLLARGSQELVAVRSTAFTHRDVLIHLAQQAVELFSGPKASRIRECAEPACPTLFVDNSQSGTKMWCSAACGARVAARAYRGRRGAKSRQPPRPER
ncbi:MAG: CGNR zinc finger domain-containing protein [Gordonia sp. (in: high G+C Gram-positive bacteria)]